MEAKKIIEVLKNRMLVDGFDIVIDLDKSSGSYLVDARNGRKFLDFYTFFASSALGMNHPKLNNEEFKNYIFKAAIHKVANSDIYTTYMGDFVDALSKIATPPYFKHFFFIDGGALAIENALKVSFDWKVRKNFKRGEKEEKGTRVIHFREAFHGRTGYTLPLTNTADPRKTMYFPKFDWPRITNPKITFPLEEHLKEVEEKERKALSEIDQAIEQYGDDIAALIIEPIQGEGGDNHFRKEFFKELRMVCDENEIMLVFDEIQCGGGITGKMWAHEHFDVQPDLMAFGKKMQVCGIMSNNRVDEVEENCFVESSRINSTWGSNITDMARSARILQVIKEDNLLDNADRMGRVLLKVLHEIEEDFPTISNVRGSGLMCAFDLPDGKKRDDFRKIAFEEDMLILGCGTKSIRFRPMLCIEEEQINEMNERARKVLKKI